MKVSKEELKRELSESLAAGVMSDRFAVLAVMIVEGHFSRSSFSGYGDEVVSEFIGFFRMRLVKHWKKLDPEKNPYSAIIQQGRWASLDSYRKFRQRRRLAERLVRFNGGCCTCQTKETEDDHD